MNNNISLDDVQGNGLSIFLTMQVNSLLEHCNIDKIDKITSLNFDHESNNLLIGVSTGFWLLSEDSKGIKGVFYEQ